MARILYGASGGEQVATPSASADAGRSGQLEPDVSTFTIWDARTGGTQITDLQDIGGGTITAVTPSADTRYRIMFYGPDGFTGALWADDGDVGAGGRFLMLPSDLATRSTSSDPAALAAALAAQAAAEDAATAAVAAQTAAIAAATAATTGLAGKVNQSAVVQAATPSTIPIRTATDARLKVGDPVDEDDATTRGWVEAQLDGLSVDYTETYETAPAGATYTLL